MSGYLNKIFAVVFTVILTISCVKFSPEEQSQGVHDPVTPNKSTSSNSKKSVNDLLKNFQGGTIELRASGIFSVTGNHDEQKLLNTNITIRGDGKLILKSSAASVFYGSHRNFYLGINEFNFIEIEEFYQGVSVFTRYYGQQMNNIKYALKQ